MRLSQPAPGRLRLGFDDDALEWPLAEVEASPRLGSTPRVLRREGHGHVECADSPLLDAWGLRPASRVEAFADWLERRKLAIAVAALAAVAGTVGFVQFGVPALAREVAERMPVEVERLASDQVVRVLEASHLAPSRLAAERQEALRAAFRELVRGEPRATQMRLHFVRGGALGPNAFALPDGRIYMTDALVDLVESNDALLAVLAHEAGHHVHRHGMRGAIESSSVLLAAGLLFGDVSGSSLAVSVPAVLLANGFSRGHEREADAYAFDLLARRGRSPRDFAEAMRRLSGAMPDTFDGEAANYLSTHPPSPDRIEAAERAAGG